MRVRVRVRVRAEAEDEGEGYRKVAISSFMSLILTLCDEHMG